ncbi:hypothetical protein SH661x_002815 [Planctomicrobium sp. SH661]|uniref:hypothetical protein n=1 Tax=Planctomicrobium sp. SH661 TaxID=3448124 RepID=UPI003F5AEAF3
MFKLPRLRWHKASNLAYVWLDGKRVYLGAWNSSESRTRYWALAAKHLPQADSVVGLPVVSDLCMRFLVSAPESYSSNEVKTLRYVLTVLEKHYGTLPCADFSPLKLKTVREELAKRHCRSQVNLHIHRIRKVFKWGAENEVVPGSVLADLACVAALRRGKSTAKESDPVKPAPNSPLKIVPSLDRSGRFPVVRISGIQGG